MYCTLDDLKAQIPEQNLIDLTDDEGTGQINQSRVDAAIQNATDIINGYVGGRYAVPFDPVPGLIRTIAVDITLYKLYERRFETEMPETMTMRYKNALKLLEQIQKGMIMLGVSASTGSESAVYRTNMASEDRIFRELLDRF